MVKAKTVKALSFQPSKSNYRKKNKRSVKKITNEKSKQNKVEETDMIEKLCISSHKGKSIEEKDKVSHGYLKELCNENDNSQTGGSGIVFNIQSSNITKYSIRTFEKISGINLKEICQIMLIIY